MLDLVTRDVVRTANLTVDVSKVVPQEAMCLAKRHIYLGKVEPEHAIVLGLKEVIAVPGECGSVELPLLFDSRKVIAILDLFQHTIVAEGVVLD